MVEAYADAVFRRDAGAWAECWDEAAVWDLAGMRVEGRTAILALWEQAMQNFPFAAFFVQPGPLTLDGDRAHGLVYTHELLINSDGTRRQTVGRYDDAYVRTAPGWRFAGRSFSILQEFTL